MAVQFNKFPIGASVHNRETNQNGQIVGIRAIAGLPEYEVIVPVDATSPDRGASLTVWSESLLELSKVSSQRSGSAIP